MMSRATTPLIGRAVAIVLALSCTPVAGYAAPRSTIAQAIADARRPATDIAVDVNRNPAALLELAGIRPGWKMADLMQGSGYFTRLFLAAAGPKGKVYDWSPPEFIKAKPALYGDSLDLLTKDYPGQVVPLRTPFADLSFPEPLDLVFQSQNYHDLHMARFPADTAAKINAVAFRSLKRGGLYIIIDHVGNPNDPTAPDRVHRLDPAVMRQEVEAAGFKFDGESAGLRNPSDDHTRHVFDPGLRGHTDQVIYRFRRP